MKKVIIIIAMLMGGLVSVLLTPVFAYADDTTNLVTQDMINKAIPINYNCDNILILKRKEDGAFCLFVENNPSDAYGSPYNSDSYSSSRWSYSYYGGGNSIDEGYYLVSPHWWTTTMFVWNSSSNSWIQYTGVSYIGWAKLTFDKYDIAYSTYNIYHKYGSLDGTLFFRVPSASLTGAITAEQITEVVTREIIGLIPLVIGLAVLAISLSKGLRHLYSQLRTL